MVPYVLRLLVKLSDVSKYWTIEKPVETICLPSIGHTISIPANNGDKQILFDVVSVVFYPERDIGPLVIADLEIEAGVDQATLTIEQIRTKYGGNINSFGMVKPKWYELYRMVDDIKGDDELTVPTLVELTRSVLVACNPDIAQENDAFEQHMYALTVKLNLEDVCKSYFEWGSIINFKDVQISPAMIHTSVINAGFFLSRAGVAHSEWPTKCLSTNKS